MSIHRNTKNYCFQAFISTSNELVVASYIKIESESGLGFTYERHTLTGFGNLSVLECEVELLGMIECKAEEAWDHPTIKKLISAAIADTSDQLIRVKAWKATCQDCGCVLLEDSEIFDGVCLECQQEVAA